jgi:hypothetical protein
LQVKSDLKEWFIWVRSYIILAPANSPEETSPWASIIQIAPTRLTFCKLKKATITKAICTTEEYAIVTFISDRRQHKIFKLLPPQTAIIIINKLISLRIQKGENW